MKIEIEEYFSNPLPSDPALYTGAGATYSRLWDSVYYCAKRNEDIYWWEHYHRFPGDLAPEYRVWFWRSFGALKWKIHMWIYYKGYKQLVRRDKWLPTFIYRIFEPAFFEYEKWYSIDWSHCPHCGFTQGRDRFIDCFDSDWFRFDTGGTRFTGEYTQHWFEGTWTCPRCLKQWEYGDSD